MVWALDVNDKDKPNPCYGGQKLAQPIPMPPNFDKVKKFEDIPEAGILLLTKGINSVGAANIAEIEAAQEFHLYVCTKKSGPTFLIHWTVKYINPTIKNGKLSRYDRRAKVKSIKQVSGFLNKQQRSAGSSRIKAPKPNYVKMWK